jgi:hypothetical protein
MMNDQASASDESKLSAYEQRLYTEVDRILYQNYFSPRTVTDFWRNDREAIIAHLRQMKDRVVRAIVIIEYVELDDVLNRVIVQKLSRGYSLRDQRLKIIRTILDKLYPQQKLDVVRKTVPSNIVSHEWR